MRLLRAIANRLSPRARLVKEVRRRAREVEARRGKPVREQLREIAALRRGPGRLDPLEYFDLGLFDDARYSWSAKAEFAGNVRNRQLDRRVNNPQWRAIADSKLVCSAMLDGMGLSTPRTLALYHPAGRSLPRLRCLRTPAELVEFLRSAAPYPIFTKPVRSHLGEGAFRLVAYDGARDEVVHDSGERRPATAFAATIDGYESTQRYGYLLQEPIRQHPVLDRMCGPTVATMRMIVALDRGSPRLLRAMLRVPRANATTDNWVGSTSGNMAAALDPASGVVQRVIAGKGVDEREVAVHPDSGITLPGLQVPDWDRCVATVLDAASLIPGLQLQHWDVAVGIDGPVLVEVNYAGGIAGSQPAHARGMLTPEFLAFVAANGREFDIS